MSSFSHASQGPQGVAASADPQLHAAGLLGNGGDQVVVAGLGGVAQRVQDLAAAGQRPGDAGVDQTEAFRVPAKKARGAVLAHQRVQAHDRALAAGSLQKAAQGVHRGQPQPGVGVRRGLLDEQRLYPVEQRNIEHELPILARQPAPQPRLDPGRHRVAGAEFAQGRAGIQRVAVQPKRDRPAVRVLGDGGQLCARQAPGTRPGRFEEARDVRGGKPQLLGREGPGVALQRQHGQRKPVGAFAKGHGEVQVGRRPIEQRVERGHGVGVAQALHLVERQHARRAVAAYRLHQQVDPIIGRRIGGVLRQVGGLTAGIARGHFQGADAGLLEGQREVGGQRHRAVLLVHRKPGDGHALPAQAMAAMGQQGGLAEAARRVQHGEAARRRRTGGLQVLARHVPLDRVGQFDLVGEEPRCVGSRGERARHNVASAVRDPFTDLGVWFVQTVSGHWLVVSRDSTM